MLSTMDKIMINHYASQVAYDTETLTSYAFKSFLQQAAKQDKDYLKFIEGVKEMIESNPAFYEKQLGRSFKFFNNVKIVKIDMNKIIDELVDDMGKIFEKTPKQFFAPGGPVNGYKNDSAASAATTNSQSKYNEHNQKVASLSDHFIKLLHDLFADLLPATKNTDTVNSRICDAYRAISDLRNLALRRD